MDTAGLSDVGLSVTCFVVLSSEIVEWAIVSGRLGLKSARFRRLTRQSAIGLAIRMSAPATEMRGHKQDCCLTQIAIASQVEAAFIWAYCKTSSCKLMAYVDIENGGLHQQGDHPGS